ncbi:MAG TPA: nicotinate-nucleotide--dimethylbenzimidazole phosphoribosyltransferase [Clostridiaceae bacterium]|nr:nicotinate-nucleotide--dimethylbenzimidazole phosphoribosyltransferase [Clostridiaceae bacterium]
MRTFSREDFFEAMQSIASPNREGERRAKFRWNSLCKPIGSFGVLETIIVRLAGLSPGDELLLRPRVVFVFAADNGIVKEGVSQAGQEVTAQVVRNIADGRATINILGRETGCVVVPVNLGVAELEPDYPGVVHTPVMPKGTNNFAIEDAMSEEEMMIALRVGMELALKASSEGFKILVAGEMGIGNTSTATAMLAGLTGRSASDLTGRGAGLSDEGLQRKIQVLTDALAAREVDRYNAFDVLRKVGGLDIAAMVGFYAGAAMTGTPVILDGLISLVAALTLVRLVQEARAVMFASYLSAEKGGEIALRELCISPCLGLNMKHGEGAGALLLLPLIDYARAIYLESLTFDEGCVEPYEVYDQSW